MRSLYRQPVFLLFITVALGVSVTTALVSLALLYQIENEKNVFNTTAHLVYEKVSQNITAAQEAVHGLDTIFYSETYIDPEKFELIANDVLARQPYISAIYFAPKVNNSQRVAFENQMREDGYINFSINQLNQSHFVSASPKASYFPVKYLEPFNPLSSRRLGYDLSSQPSYEQAILQSIDTAAPVALGPVNIDNNEHTYLLFKATFSGKNAPTSLNERRSLVNGLLVLQINSAELLGQVLPPEHLHITLIMNNNPSAAFQQLHHDTAISTELSHWTLTELNSELGIVVGGNPFTLKISKPLLWHDMETGPIYLAVGVGVLISVLFALLMLNLVKRAQELALRNQQVQDLVDIKTKELAEEKDLLQQEVEQRQRVEQESIRLGKILDESFNEIYVFDAGTLRFIQVNKGALNNLGYTLHEIKQMTAVDLKPEITWNEFQTLVQPLREGRTHRKVFETIHQRKDGSQYPVEVRLQCSKAGSESVFVAIIEDISERKRVQEHMLKLSSAVENSGDLIMITDNAGVIEYVNPAFETITGYTKDEVIGKHPNVLKSGEINEALYNELWTTIRSGKHFRSVFINRKKDQSLYYEEKTITPIKDKHGTITNFVATGKDITEREQARQLLQQQNELLAKEINEREAAEAELRNYRNYLEELVTQRTLELEKSRDEALEANSAKSRFLMNMSHELRTPLNAIIGYGELISEELEQFEQADVQEDLHRIIRSGQHLLGLINDLLDLSRIEAGKLELVLETISITDVVRAVENTVRPLIQKNLNQFALQCPADIGDMIADEMRLRQILINLLSNAAKFTKQGKISLTVNKIGEDGAKWLEFVVNDTGIGMKQEKISKIFEEFEQADKSINLKYGGSGLGLAISRRLCEKMGGTITATSQPDQGSTFTLTFPLNTESVAPNAFKVAR